MSYRREQFTVTDEWAYLNHCAVAPLASTTVAAMERQIRDQQANGVMHHGDWAREAERARGRAAALLGAQRGEIAFVRNTVEGVGIVAEGLDWRAGDNVVTAYGEYPANVYPWLSLAARGVETRIVSDRVGRIVADDLFEAVDDRTRLIALSFVEFANGFRTDLPRVGAFCRENGLRFFVDGIQGIGALALNVAECGIDFLAAGAQKWLLGPPGIGIFYCRKERLEELRVTRCGPESMVPREEYLPYDRQLRPDARRFEAGAQNYAGIYGLGATLDTLLEIGVSEVEAHILALLDVAIDGLRQRGCDVQSSVVPAERSGIVAFRNPRVDTGVLLKRLVRAKVAVSARSGGIRVAPHFYNDTTDVERLLAAVGA